MSWKQKVPLICRMKINKLRKIRKFSDLFGRYAVGAMRGYVAFSVSSNEWSRVAIGKDVQIHRGTLLHINGLSNATQIKIDSRVFIGQNCYFSAGKLISLGHDSLIGASCRFLGAGHVYSDPQVPYAKAKVVSYGEIVLEPNCWVGTGSTLVGDVHIGFGAVIAASSLVRGVVPPLSLVAGSPSQIRKLFNWHTKEWCSVSDDPIILEKSLQDHISNLPSLVTFINSLKFNAT
ncbi:MULTISPECIES: acyltransferase [unclassified Undibacterium]|nr:MULTISPECIES: acyltransferase [unclassified Undibacterium]MEB0140841.1 acyltransferase [Undibacterium sp. CCC2.1]MEB0173814.1 acyltransferase [Undibacterium sp. CCC1.1]MEB0177798.1 acyltransferase [Undibacterium sp. CCC3.4]MEB0217344.1 acyltransferase [Undibacterium sp. 5I2]WPX42153.1 acyltransferase [Undibacterium sp. CCC3.4]